MKQKADKVRLAVAAVAGTGHLIQTGVFFAFGHPRLAVASFGAVVVFVVVAWLVRRGMGRIGGWLAYLEILSHLSFMIWVWGPAAGYWTYYVPLAGGAFIAFAPEERWDRRIGTIIPFVVAPIAFLWSRGRSPAIDVSETMLSTLALMNVFGALLGTASIVAWFASVADREHARSENLLRNILPEPIAARLKEGPTTIVDSFEGVTVLFADIVGFTTLSQRITTSELIVVLNEIFSAFDALAAKHGLEKIKTIGDAYMVVGGVPAARADHAEAVAAMALDMRDAIAKRADLDIRIGIHSGPVVAGVIGTKKFSYDLWGDTVNTASRMESHGEPGKIQVSDATHDLLGERFTFTERGSITVKGKGDMHTWYLDRER